MDAVIIVDIMSTGYKYLDLCEKYEFTPIHIRSDLNTPSIGQEVVQEKIYDASIDYSFLKEMNVIAIIPGCEKGVPLADFISEELGINNCNDYQLTEARWNKFLMGRALEERHVRAVKGQLISNVDELRAWHQKNLSTSVMKPIRNAASDKVFLYEGFDKGKKLFEETTAGENIFGNQINSVVVQEYVEGIQYFVNTVSCDGFHVVTDIWKLNRERNEEGAFFFEDMSLEPAQDEKMIDYVFSCLDALGVRYGACHSEVIFDKDGFVLIETNSRLMGASISDEAFSKACPILQHEASFMSYVTPDVFLATYKDFVYKTNGRLAEVSFYIRENGILKTMPAIEEIEKMDSFVCFSGLPVAFSKVEKDYSSLGTGGFAYLFSNNQEVINNDLKRIANLKKAQEIFTIV